MGFFDDFKKILVDFEATIIAEVKEEIEAKMTEAEAKPVSDYILPYMNMQNVDGTLVDMNGKDLKVNDITDELKLSLGISMGYPKVFTKGIAAHGYGDTHNGMGNADKVDTSTDIISRIGWTSASRNYCGAAVSNNFESGYAYSGLNNVSPTDDAAPAAVNTGFTETKMATETFTEHSATLATGKRTTAIWTKMSYSLVYNCGDGICRKHDYSTHNVTVQSGLPGDTNTDNHNNGGFSDWNRGIGYKTESNYAGCDLLKVDFSTNTLVGRPKNTVMEQLDQGTASFIEKVIVESSGNATHTRHFFAFANETFSITSPSINNSGECMVSPGNGHNYSLGGYDSDNGSQHNRSEKQDQNTGTVTSIGTSTYSMSAAAQYIH